jgi:hypothetical protein
MKATEMPEKAEDDWVDIANDLYRRMQSRTVLVLWMENAFE